jgi:hypothetical protein
MAQTPLTFVDRPRLAHKIVSLIVFGAGVFMLSKALAEPPPEPRIKWMAGAFCLISGAALGREFLFRPVRVTVIDPARGLIQIEEKAPLSERALTVPITFETHFDFEQDDPDNHLSFQVRLRAKGQRDLPVMEFLSRLHAEEIARQANAHLARQA